MFEEIELPGRPPKRRNVSGIDFWALKQELRSMPEGRAKFIPSKGSRNASHKFRVALMGGLRYHDCKIHSIVDDTGIYIWEWRDNNGSV